MGETHANVPSVKVDDFAEIGADSGAQTLYIPAKVGQKFSVTVTLDPGLLEGIIVSVSLGSAMGTVTQPATAQLSESKPTATLTYTANLNDQSVYDGVPLTVSVSSSAVGVPDYAYGELAGAVHFSNTQGFVFESGGQHSDSHTLRLTKTVDVPDLSTKWMQTDWTAKESMQGQDEYESPDVYFEFLTYVTSSSNEALGITNDNPTANRDTINAFTTNHDISVNYKQGGLYADIQLFDFDTYLPELKMGVATVKDGKATITATHAATGMEDTISVTAHTLRDQFYLFQVTPAVTTTLRYTNGEKVERTVTTNSEGVLALYEPSGIASDVWLSSTTSDGTEYLGTIYNYNLQSGEGDARKLQLYPLNTFRLREAAKAELTLVKPDGSPLAKSEVIVRGGVYKNGYYCETAGPGTTRNDIGATGEAQQDTTFTTDENGKLTVYFDFTQFWSAEAGETEGSLPTAEDTIQYVLEVRNIANNDYYPLFQMVDGTVSPMQEMRTASGVVVLEEVPQDEGNKPFVARQVIDYHLNDGALIDIRHSTGFVGPNYNFKEAVLTTDMLLWGESGDGASYSLAMVDENGYVPEA